MKNILAIIPARSGSKGILNKNIRRFAGKPLIGHTISEAKQSRFLNRIVVSTDSEEIAAVAKRYGAEIPCLRPKSLARDKSKVVDAILHILSCLKDREQYLPDYLVLLQVTSPLREAHDIDGALKLLFSKGAAADAVVSVCGTEQLLFTKDQNDQLYLANSKDFLKSTNRKDLPPTYKLDGSMVYAIKTKTFLKEKTFLPKKLVAYVIPRWKAVDLDEPQDFVVGELIYKNKEAIKSRIKNL